MYSRDEWSSYGGSNKVGSQFKPREVALLKIQRSESGRVVFKLSGRIEAEDAEELQQLLALEPAGRQLILDLRDVTLVNQEAVQFLASCEADGTNLENCPLYIREWIEQKCSFQDPE